MEPRLLVLAFITHRCHSLVLLAMRTFHKMESCHLGCLTVNGFFFKGNNFVTVKILKIGTPEIITIIVLQMEQLDFTVQYCVQKMQTE